MYLNIQLTNALRSIGSDWVPLSQTDLWHGHIQAEDAQDLVEDLAIELKPLHEQNRFYGVWTLDTIFEDSNGHFHILPNFSLDIIKNPSLQQLISPFSAYELVTDNFLWPLGPHTDVYGLGQVIRTLLMKVMPTPAVNRTMQDQEPLSNYQVQFFTQSQLQAIDKACALEIPARFANLDEFSVAIGTSGQSYNLPVSSTDESGIILPDDFDFESKSEEQNLTGADTSDQIKEDIQQKDEEQQKDVPPTSSDTSKPKDETSKGFIGGLFKGKSKENKSLDTNKERKAREKREAEEKPLREEEERKAREAREAEEKRRREEERKAREVREAEEKRRREEEERKAREAREAEEKRLREEEERKRKAILASATVAKSSSVTSSPKAKNDDNLLSIFDNENARPLEPVKPASTNSNASTSKSPDEGTSNKTVASVATTTIATTGSVKADTSKSSKSGDEKSKKTEDKSPVSASSLATASVASKDNTSSESSTPEQIDMLKLQSANAKNNKKKGSLLPIIFVVILLLCLGGLTYFLLSGDDKKSPNQGGFAPIAPIEKPKEQPALNPPVEPPKEELKSTADSGNNNQSPESALSALFDDKEDKENKQKNPEPTSNATDSGTATVTDTNATSTQQEPAQPSPTDNATGTAPVEDTNTTNTTNTTNSTDSSNQVANSSTTVAPTESASETSPAQSNTTVDQGQSETTNTTVDQGQSETTNTASATTDSSSTNNQDANGQSGQNSDLSNLVANPDKQTEEQITEDTLKEEEKRLADEAAKRKAEEDEAKRKQAEDAEELRRQTKKLEEANRQKIAKRGTLLFSVVPWGDVKVNGRKYGASPPFKHLNVSPGKYKITITNGEFPPAVYNVEVTEGKTTTVHHVFQ
ncbi:PEGA domain-containing protein [Taylorella equigenitalis]|uniref:PEGA domain-containing protein n=1 Tax=Taylorella equigenitalis TaxID=29575 RepID=UPI00240E5DCF|nr:PEGA domain-containing protein [Taylorella equigenitalis]WFD80008.1 PEGA domain-containing protein [Taylorella equigenitalis]WGU10584.1 PEGA domain-containing protein [Taylorella equigenitalis]